MSENPSAIQKFLNKYHVAPWVAAVIGACIGFFFVCFGFWLPFSPSGIDPVTKELKLGGNLDNWRANAWFLFAVAFCIFAGLALMFASIQVVRGEERRSQRDRQIVYGLNTVVGTVLVLIVLAVINLLAFTEPIDQMLWRAFSRDFDWTKGTMYTLSPKTISYLEGLAEPVKVYSLLDTDDAGYTEMTTLLRAAQAQSKKLTWERLTLVPRPDAKAIELIRKYGIKEPKGGVLLIAGDEGGKHDHEFIPNNKIASQAFDRMGRPSRNVTFSGENALLGSLTSLLEGQVVVYFTQGHGEPPLDGGMPKMPGMPRAEGGLSKLRSKLTENRRKFDVKPLAVDKALTKVPEDATAVVIVRPTQPLGENETKVLADYLARKGETNPDKTVKVAPGRLMVLLDPVIRKEASGATFAPTGLETFLAGYGVQLPNERIQIFVGPDPLRITTIVKPDPNSTLSAAFNEMDGAGRLLDYTEFAMENVRVVRPVEGAKGPYKADTLMLAISQGMWVEKELGVSPVDRAALLRGDVAMRKKLMSTEPVSAAVSVSTSGGPPKMPGMPDDAAHGGGGKEQPLMAVFGSASWVSDEGLTGRSGALRADLFSSALSWLRGQGEMGVDLVPGKVNQEYELNVPPQNLSRLRWMPLMMMVLAVASLGIGVWVVRRR